MYFSFEEIISKLIGFCLLNEANFVEYIFRVQMANTQGRKLFNQFLLTPLQ